MGGWEVIQDIDDGDDIPAQSTIPDFRGSTRSRISPDCGVRAIVTVLQETRLAGVGICAIRMRERELLDNIVKGGGVCWVIVVGVMGVERRNHVQTIEPHLIRVG